VFDWYRRFLAHAKWTWNEYGRFHSDKRHKDRRMGRAEKRSAHQRVSKEIKDEQR